MTDDLLRWVREELLIRWGFLPQEIESWQMIGIVLEEMQMREHLVRYNFELAMTADPLWWTLPVPVRARYVFEAAQKAIRND